MLLRLPSKIQHKRMALIKSGLSNNKFETVNGPGSSKFIRKNQPCREKMENSVD